MSFVHIAGVCHFKLLNSSDEKYVEALNSTPHFMLTAMNLASISEANKICVFI